MHETPPKPDRDDELISKIDQVEDDDIFIGEGSKSAQRVIKHSITDTPEWSKSEYDRAWANAQDMDELAGSIPKHNRSERKLAKSLQKYGNRQIKDALDNAKVALKLHKREWQEQARAEMEGSTSSQQTEEFARDLDTIKNLPETRSAPDN